ncbi:MAG: fibronectin type III domain-containing protein, partial [Candidatus Dojkabacteria bacterium]|nr:fibronectin type III domain-containing protein [Candidatus Dojkabacteria bacterium]
MIALKVKNFIVNIIKKIQSCLLAFVFIIFLGLFTKNNVFAASVTWDGGGDATSWSDGLNWSTDTVPTDVDDVTIDSDVTVNLASTTTVNSLTLGNSGGTTTVVLNFSYNSVGNSTPLVIDEGDLVIYSGGTITHTVGTTVVIGSINIDVQTGDLIINSGGSINASEKGYGKGYGPGVGTTYTGSGHGGYGGTAPDGTAGGVSYDVMENPTNAGSGGSNTSRGGIGGGLVKISIGNNLSLDGIITANGGAGTTGTTSAGGGGSGGAINLSIGNIFSGSGSISANGGRGGSYMRTAGGGGGGRIAITDYYSKTFSGTITAYAGAGYPNYNSSSIAMDGGAGTIFLQANSGSPDIIIDNGTNTDLTDGGITIFSYASYINSLSISNYSYIRIDSTLSVGDIDSQSNSYVIFNSNVSANNLSITGGSDVFINSNFVISQLLDLDGGYLNIDNSAEVNYATFNFNGELVDNGGGFTYLEGSTLLIPSGATLYGNYQRSFTSGLIEGTLTHSSNIDTLINKIDYTFTGDFTVASEGSIDVSEKGYYGGYGSGAGVLGSENNGGGGGSHGGDGGDGNSGYLGGVAYDSSTNPQDFGSGGGGNSGIVGGSGGGLIILNIGGTFDLQGSIIANGGDGTTRWGYYSSGGAGGGSVNITTNTFTGSGSLQAIGGTAYPSVSDRAYGGGGGGGLIYILYNSSSFTGTADVSGGVGFDNGDDGISTIQVSNQTPVANASDLSNTSNLYAGLSYSIDAIYSDLDGETDLSQLYLKIENPDGEDIELRANNSSSDLEDQTASILLGSTYVANAKYSIYPSYGTSNEVKVVWSFDIGWNWSQSISIEYGVKASDSLSATSSYSLTTEGFIYKNTLEFNSDGSLVVTDSSDNLITSESWMLADTSVDWTGYKVVYTGETNIYPNVNDYNIKLEDGTGRFWLDSGTYGVNFQITTDTLSDTTDENIYTLSIIDIPTGGSSSDTKTFIIKVDADNPVISSLSSTSHSTEGAWYSTNIFTALWNVLDNQSGLGSVYRYLSSSASETATSIESNGTITSLTEWTSGVLNNGLYYFYILVNDLVGNQTTESYSLKIDASVPDIVDITGLYEDQWQNIDSGPTIYWTDPKSTSDDIFYITTDGSVPSASNFRYATNQNSYNLPSLGDGEFSVKVRARNGAGTYSETRTFIVKYDSQSPSAVKNISVSVSSKNRVTFTWANPTDSDFSKVVVLRKKDSVSSNPSDGTKVYEGSAGTFTGATLSSSTKYYFSFWAYDNVGNVSSRTSVNLTTLDLEAPKSPTNLKVNIGIDDEVEVTWKNPNDTDFAKVILFRDG